MKITLVELFIATFGCLVITNPGNALQSRERREIVSDNSDKDAEQGTNDITDLISVSIRLRFTDLSNEDVIPAVNISVPQGKTAFQLLQLASKRNPCFLFEYQTFQKLGRYITTICGVSQSNKSNFYWYIYINNTLSPVGVDLLEPNHRDIIRFEYRYMNSTDGNQIEPAPTSTAVVTEKEESVKMISVSVKLTFTNYPSPNVIPEQAVIAPIGTAAFEILQLAAKLNPCYAFNYKTFSIGRYITTICRVQENRTRHFYWFIYLNEKLSPVGADLLKPKHGDTLKFEYRAWNPRNSNHTLPTPTKTPSQPLITPTGKGNQLSLLSVNIFTLIMVATVAQK